LNERAVIPPVELRQVIELLHEGVLIRDASGLCVYVNEGVERAMGVPAQRLLGESDTQSHLRLRRTDHTPLPLEESPSYEARITLQPVHRRRLAVARDDGTFRELLVSAEPLLGPEGKLAWVVVAIQDVTRELQVVNDLRAEQEQLVRARELLSEAFELADLAVIERDLGTGTTHLTSRLRELLGLAEGTELTGATLDQFVVADDQQRYAEYLEKLEPGLPPPPLELRLKTAKSERREVRLWGRRARTGGSTRELIVVQDVTEQALVQAKLRLAERLTSLGTMAAGVAHEINNPLAFVLANLNVVKGELTKLPPTDAVDVEDLRDAVSEAIEGAERVRQIVLGLKPFTRVDEHQRGHCDVARIAEASLNMAKNELRHRARIVKQLRQVAPVYANEARLGQVFLNLLVNAAHAMPDGHAGENLLTISTREENDMVVVSVSDTGHGIAPDVLPRIFDPFFSTKAIGQGTGLGLFISQGIVNEVGGVITVTSTPGVGTTFEVRLPPAVQGFKGTSASPPPVRKRARVLVVDDEPSILRSLERLLGKQHDLTVAQSGREALALLHAGLHYDLVLCDLMMPEVSGIDVWEQLDDDQRSRIVFMTGGTFTPRAEQFLEESRPPVLEKPFTSTTLEGLLQRAQTR
jgi:PAS domain S-box-containing protein